MVHLLRRSAAVTNRPAPTAADAPPGWAYNPSGWNQRIPIILLGFTGMVIASYLAAFQLGYTATVWDPVFGSASSEAVLDSRVSRLFPVSDALLGALGYAGDWIFGAVGGRQRYRTMPWVVIVFGVFIIPFGGTSVALALLMPTFVGAWCFLCLVNAAIAIVLIPMAWDEVWLTILEMRRVMREGRSFGEALRGVD